MDAPDHFPLSPFHLAFPVDDLDAARAFYGGLLGCPEGRSSDRWIDYDFFGHQVVAHMVDEAEPESGVDSNAVDGHDGVTNGHEPVFLSCAAGYQSDNQP